MKRTATVLTAGLLAWVISVPCFAWEFEMRGEYELRFQYFARTGSSDLFGLSTLQELGPVAGPGTFIGFAGPNIYGRGPIAPVPADNASGVIITRGGFSRWGSDAFFSDSRLTLYPTVNVNPAIKLQSVYTIGGYRNKYALTPAGVGLPPFERYYMSQVSMNAYDTAAIGSWEQFRATINTPFAIVSMGVKDFPFGTGATLAYNTRAEHVMALVPYGPFKFQWGIWVARGNLLAQESWATNPDWGSKRSLFQTILISYQNGPLDVGAGTIFSKYHGNADDVPDGIFDAGPGLGLDDITWINMVYGKYNNGRFFANAEYAWINIDRFRPAAPLVAPAFATQRYREGCHAFAEAGVVVGPSKLTTMGAWVPGRQLANPIAGNPVFPNPTKQYIPFPLNYQALVPYNFLMFQTYGGGEGGFGAGGEGRFGQVGGFDGILVADGTGMLADAWSVAARLDYAVAANLNFWGSYIWATRVEKDGFWAGEISSGLPGDVALGTPFVAPYGGTSPFAGNRFLGWESNIGIDWKLLEGLTMSARYAFWQPGEWFDFAYQAATPGSPTGGGILQGRDPIQAIQGSFLISF